MLPLSFVECFQSFDCDDHSSFDCVVYVGCIGVWIVCVVLPCFETILRNVDHFMLFYDCGVVCLYVVFSVTYLRDCTKYLLTVDVYISLNVKGPCDWEFIFAFCSWSCLAKGEYACRLCEGQFVFVLHFCSYIFCVRQDR